MLVELNPESREPQRLPLDTAHSVSNRAFLAGDLVVYGAPSTSVRPELAELGCEVIPGGRQLSTVAASREDRIVHDGRGLVPLVSFPGRPGQSIACSGPAAVAAAPLYVVPGATARGLVPLAGYCLAALLLPVGGVGIYLLRISAV